MTEFRELGVSEATLRGLAIMGFDEPTPIQARAIPCLLAGRDVIAQALTGTGKTAAFGVPLVDRIDPEQHHPQAIVLTPTRELAIQVTDHLSKIGHERRITVLPIYGGQPIGRQLHALHRGVHVVVATPGRLLDHMRRETIDLSGVRTLVLDEADQMLEMGFIEDVEYVLEHLPTDRVTALFSATMPKPIVDLAGKYLRDPELIRLSAPQGLTAPEIDQVYLVVPFVRKMDALCRVLDVRQPERAIVFCATKRMVDEAVEGLTARGYQTEALHGDITQVQRERVLRAFRNGQIEVLVATDVAARGLDVPEVSHVINFDIPPDPEYYVHRIGRTGRYGRGGVAITFVNPREMRVLKLIERSTGARIRREEVPTAAEAEEREVEILSERLLTALSKGGWGRYRPVVEELLEDHDAVDVAAAALGLVAGGAVGTRRVAVASRVAIGRPATRPDDRERIDAERPRPRFRRDEEAGHERDARPPAARRGSAAPDHEAAPDVRARLVSDEAAEAIAEAGDRRQDKAPDPPLAAPAGGPVPASMPPAGRQAPRRSDERRPGPTRAPASSRPADRRPTGPGPRRSDGPPAFRGGAPVRRTDPPRDAPSTEHRKPRPDRRDAAGAGSAVPSWDDIRATIERASIEDRGTEAVPPSSKRRATGERAAADGPAQRTGGKRAPKAGGTRSEKAGGTSRNRSVPKGGPRAGKGKAGGPKDTSGGGVLPAGKKGRRFVSVGGLKARRQSGPARGGRGAGHRS